MLVKTGGFQGGSGDRHGELVEEQQVGFELAHFVGAVGAFGLLLAPDAFEQLPAGTIGDGGGIAFGAAADVDAAWPTVDPLGTVVISPATGARLPGHEGVFRSGAVRTV